MRMETMDDTEPAVVISVLNWNQRDMTLDCIETLRERTLYPNVDIVVVDNGSDDGSVAAINEEFPGVSLIENETNRGFGPAHNQVLEGFDADYYVLFNNDAVPKEGWLRPLVEFAAEHPDVGVQGPELRFPSGRIHSGGFFGPLGGHRRLVDEGEITTAQDVDWVSGAVFFLSRDIVEDVGTLDEIFAPIYFEEVDYCWRAGEHGYRVVYNPNSVVVHDGEEDEGASDRLIFLMRKHELVFRLLNYPLHWLPFLFIDEVRIFAGAVLASDRTRRVKQYLRAYLSLLSDGDEVLKTRIERS